MKATNYTSADNPVLPVLLSVKDAEKIGLTRSAFYPVIPRRYSSGDNWR